MITNNSQENTLDKWHYFAVKNIPRLFRGITSSNHGDFYCFGCLHSFRTKKTINDYAITTNIVK